jgi:hypothetical protein
MAQVAAYGQNPPETAAERVRKYFEYVNKQLLDMAQDFPENKYDFRLTKEMRTFGDVVVHVASGNVYGVKAGGGEKANWDELDPKNYTGKAAILDLLRKSIADSEAVLKANPEGPKKNFEPWLAIMEHSAEHYGLLVAYYRANGLVPPASRPKNK